MSIEKSARIQRPLDFWPTLVYLYTVCVIEGADLQLLPATFRALERTLGLSPSHLATLGLAQALTQCVSGPIWASFADHGWSRKTLLVGGTFSWGFLTLLLAMVTDFSTMVVLRTFNGAALGTLMPISQSLIADMTRPEERGVFFGLAQFFINSGVAISAILAASVSNLLLWGFEGWRVAFAVVAAASFALALVMGCCMKEPSRAADFRTQPLSYDAASKRFFKYMRIRTFRVIALQGAFGSVPWSALSFMILFYQCIGISDGLAATMFAASIAGSMGGGILGGFVGDRLTRFSRNHGRPWTAQISVASGIPIIVAVLAVVPREPASFKIYFSLMFFLGLLASWCSVGVNRPILSEVVGEADRASIIAWLVALDGSFAAVLGAPVVGLLAERAFGYQPSKLQIAEMPATQRAANAAALGQAMLYLTVGPWLICLCFYSLLHWTYGPDIDWAVRERSEEKWRKDHGTENATETSALL